MSAMISRELRGEVLAEAKKKNAGTVASVKRMYRNRIQKTLKGKHATSVERAKINGKIDHKVAAVIAL